MKDYIKENLAPMAIGFCIALIFAILMDAAENIILSIAIMVNK